MSIQKDANGFSILEVMLFVFALVVVVASGIYVISRHNPNDLDISSTSSIKLQVSRENPFNQPGVTNFSISVSTSDAKKILNDLNNLKPVPGGPNDVYNCPNDDGVSYKFAFSNPTLIATAMPTGCSWARVNDKSFFTTTSFWKDVSSATHQAVDPNIKP